MKNNDISLLKLQKILKSMQTIRNIKIENKTDNLNDNVRMKILMSCRDFKVNYYTLGDEITVIFSKKEYGYSVINPKTSSYYVDHYVSYNKQTKKMYAKDDDILAKYIIKCNRKELNTIFKTINKYSFLDKKVYYDIFNNGKISISLDGNINCESEKDEKLLGDIMVSKEELPMTFKKIIDFKKRG